MHAFAVPTRARPRAKLTADELDERAAAVKAWSTYKLRESRARDKRMLELTFARDNALAELKVLDMKLYNAAITVDEALFPINFPVVTDTPPKDQDAATPGV